MLNTMNFIALATVFLISGSFSFLLLLVYSEIVCNKRPSISVATYSSVEAIQCYQCDSATNASCNTPFDLTLGAQYLVTCGSAYICCEVK